MTVTYRLRKNKEAKQRLEDMVSQADSLFMLAKPPDGVRRKLKKSRRSAPGTRTRARVRAKGKHKSKETVSSDDSEQPLALTLKKRAVKVRPRPMEKKVQKGKDSDHVGAGDDMGRNAVFPDIPLRDNNEPTSPKDSANAEETVS
jgi:hypothetical protein